MSGTEWVILGVYGLGWLAVTVGPWLVGFWLVCYLIEAIGAPKQIVINQSVAEPSEPAQASPIRVVSWKAWHDTAN